MPSFDLLTNAVTSFVNAAFEEADAEFREAQKEFVKVKDSYAQALIMDEAYKGSMYLVALNADSDSLFRSVGGGRELARTKCEALSAVEVLCSENKAHVVGLPAIRRAMRGESSSMTEYLAVEGFLARMLTHSWRNVLEGLAVIECWICVMEHLVPKECITRLVGCHSEYEQVMKKVDTRGESVSRFEVSDAEKMAEAVEVCLELRGLIGDGVMRELDPERQSRDFTASLLEAVSNLNE